MQQQNSLLLNCLLLLLALKNAGWCQSITYEEYPELNCYPSATCYPYSRGIQCEDNCQAHANCNQNPQLVRVANGLVQGLDNGLYLSWLGIPYAKPPLGNLRFEPPQPYNVKWSYVFNATQPAKLCSQWFPYGPVGADNLIGEEDCLTLSVFKSKTDCRKKFPVLVVIHGGSFMWGGEGFGVQRIISHAHVIIVFIRYRLGAIGFLSTQDEVIGGNFGLKDQRLALDWIYNNIGCFGGDRNNITLFGHASGGISVHLHLMHPELRNYAKAAISSSGTALSPWVITKNARVNAFELGKLLNCSETTDSKVLKCCLQQKRAKDINRAAQSFLNVGSSPFTTFGPVTEHKCACQPYMTITPEEMIRSGQISDTPLLLGLNSENGGYNIAEYLRINPKTYKEYIYELNYNWDEVAVKNLFLQNTAKYPLECARELRKKYMGYDYFSVESYPKVEMMYTDVLFKNDIYRTIELHQKYCAPSIYLYNYSNARDPGAGSGFIMSGRTDIKFGTQHLDDVSMLFLFTSRGPLRYDEQIISGHMIDMTLSLSAGGGLKYDNCDFVDNTAKISQQVEYLLITRNSCQIVKENFKQQNSVYFESVC